MNAAKSPLPSPTPATSRAGERVTIAYGRIHDPERAVEHEIGTLHPDNRPLTPRLAMVVPGEAGFRLNSPGWHVLPPGTLPETTDNLSMLRFAYHLLENRTPVFAGAIRAFLTEYITFIEAAVERQRDMLRARLSAAAFDPDASFPHWKDWMFSAWLPLPNAYVGWSRDDRTPKNFTRCDLAFWTGKQLVMIILCGRNLLTGREREGLTELARLPYVSIVEITGDGPLSHRRWFTEELSLTLDGFYEDCELPFGLLRQAVLTNGSLPE